MANQACVTSPAPVVPGATGAGLLSGVALASNSLLLSRAAVLFASRNPTPAEASATAAGGATALRQTIRGYMQGPAFDAFLSEVGDTHFLTPGVNPRNDNNGLHPADWPSATTLLGVENVTQANDSVKNRFDASIRREPIELMKYIINNDLPYTDMVSGSYTVVNSIMATYLNATVEGPFANTTDDNEFRKATLPSQRLGGLREHAGVLSTHAWLQRFPTTESNRNRHRVNILFQQFLATDLSALGTRPLDDTSAFKIPTVENPDCAACHSTIDPIAAGFQNWDGANRYRPNLTGSVDHALPKNYLSSKYPKDAANRAYYQPGDNWFRDGAAPGYGGVSMPEGFKVNATALQWLGGKVANDPRFAQGAVHFWYEGVFGRPPLKAPTDPSSPLFATQQAAYSAQNEELKAIAARFATDRGNGRFNMRDLLVDLVTTPWFRAEHSGPGNATPTRQAELSDAGSMNMLTPAALNRKLMGIVGRGWSDFNNPYSGWGLTYGEFDGSLRTHRAKSYTLMQQVTIDLMISKNSCNITKSDFDKPMASRLLFPHALLTDLPSSETGKTAIQKNILHLHKVLWKEDVPATDTEVQRTLKLFNDVRADRDTAPIKPVNCSFNNSNDPNYTGRAWATVIGYMLGDYKFLYE